MDKEYGPSRPTVGVEKARESSPTSWQLGPFVRANGSQPLLTPNRQAVFLDPVTGKETPWAFSHVFNPAAIAWNDNLYVLFRAEDDTGNGIGTYTSRIGLAQSSDGVKFTVLPQPVFYPQPGCHHELEWPGGCEDPRIVQAEDGTFYMTYTMWNQKLWQMGMASSKDLRHWQRHGPAFLPTLRSKSGSIITRKVGDKITAARINGLYYMYWHNGRELSLATSVDLLHWVPALDTDGQLRVALPRLSRNHFVEPGPPALLTKHGIVLLYNGFCDDHLLPGANVPALRYSARQALFAADDPGQLLARMEQPFFGPQEPWEVTGQYGAGTTFVEGLAWFRNQWYLFYGAADTCVGMALANG